MVKLIVIDNIILYESIINGIYNIMSGQIPNNLLIEDNLLKIKIGEIENIEINNQKLFLNKN